MYPGRYCDENGSKAAVVMAETGEAVTFSQLETRSQRLAQLLFARGLRRGDHLAILMENTPSYFEVVWAGLRSGLYITPINFHLTEAEVGYILRDSEAKTVVVSASLARVLPGLTDTAAKCKNWLAVGGDVEGYERYEKVVARAPARPLESEPVGQWMLYSSGTTGWPKGIKAALPNASVREYVASTTRFARDFFGFDDSTVYLSPAPLYHSAPMCFSVGAQAMGGTVVIMKRFDALEALRSIGAYHVTHSQWVPTMFVRMLKLGPEQRSAWDLSTHRTAIHAAAPCPRSVKEQMLAWWGPILHEYYSGTEGVGRTYVGPEDWLKHPGTVGRAVLGDIHICAADGADLPAGQTGSVYFARDEPIFEYHNAPEKTRSGRHPDHETWATLGDIGYVNDEGYLFLTDRSSFMIVAGGVNIYPQEIENVLIMHPMVADVAVIGVPNGDLGEEVKAVIQLEAGHLPRPHVAEEILAYARDRMARYKVPRSVDFKESLPRLATGKLAKSSLRDEYWPAKGRSKSI